MQRLPIFLNLAGRPVILIGDGAAAAAKRRLLERAGAVVVPETEPASLAIVALDDDRLRGVRVQVVGYDQFGLDANNDGYGCDTLPPH